MATGGARVGNTNGADTDSGRGEADRAGMSGASLPLERNCSGVSVEKHWLNSTEGFDEVLLEFAGFRSSRACFCVSGEGGKVEDAIQSDLLFIRRHAVVKNVYVNSEISQEAVN